jgi:hypothetical protein
MRHGVWGEGVTPRACILVPFQLLVAWFDARGRRVIRGKSTLRMNMERTFVDFWNTKTVARLRPDRQGSRVHVTWCVRVELKRGR